MILIGQIMQGLLLIGMVGMFWDASLDSMGSRVEKVAFAWERGKVRPA